MGKSSRISGFHKMSIGERRRIIEDFRGLSAGELDKIDREWALDLSTASNMIENVIGTYELPMGVAVNFLINNKEYIVPMVVEEASVVAACSNAARLVREGGGFITQSTESIMIGQIQVTEVVDPRAAKVLIHRETENLLKIANERDKLLLELGGGARDIEVRIVNTPVETFVVLHLLVNVKDAMGANVVNTMVEALAPIVEEITGGKVLLRIISNLADRRLVRAMATVPKEVLGGEEEVDKIIKAYYFAASDPYRAATHNKGIMNGMSSVALATGNDTRALEAGAHAYAATRPGGYTSLTFFEKDNQGNLRGSIEVPLAVGIIGGATAVHPKAKNAFSQILGINSAKELGEVIASVGLAQCMAALRVLVSEGIQKGHMKLHAKNIAVMAGATGEMIDKVSEQIVKEKMVRIDRAKEVLEKLQK